MIDNMFLIYCVTMGMLCNSSLETGLNTSSLLAHPDNWTTTTERPVGTIRGIFSNNIPIYNNWTGVITVSTIGNWSKDDTSWCNGTVTMLMPSSCALRIDEQWQKNRMKPECMYADISCCQGTECGKRFEVKR